MLISTTTSTEKASLIKKKYSAFTPPAGKSLKFLNKENKKENKHI